MGKKIHILIAPQPSEYGSACFAMLANYYGENITLIDSARLCDITQDGCTLDQICDAAKTLELDTEISKLDLGQLKANNEPCILKINDSFTILEKIKNNKVVLCTPDEGRISMSLEQFESQCGNEVLFLIPQKKSTGVKRRSAALSYPLSVISRTNKSYIVLYVGLLIGIIVTTFLISQLTSNITDCLFSSTNSGRFTLDEKININLLLLIVLFLIEATYVMAFARLSAKISTVCRSDYVWSALNIPLDLYAIRSDGYFMKGAHMTRALGIFLSKKSVDIIINPIMALICLIIISIASPMAGGLVIAYAVLMVVFVIVVAKHQQILGELAFCSDSKNSGFLLNGLKAIRSIRNSGSEFVYFREFVKGNRDLTRRLRDYSAISGVSETIPTTFSNITKLIMILSGLVLIYQDHLTYGGLIFIHGVYCVSQGYINTAVTSGRSIINFRNNAEHVGSIYLEAKKSLDLSEENKKKLSDSELSDKDYVKLRGQIELKNVSFGYSKYSSEILHNISMSIPAGSCIAIVGASGSGKTTLKKLICGRHTPLDGEILFDGKTREEIPEPILKHSIAAVDQQIVIFRDSIMNNIKMWDDSQIDADAILGARDAEIHDRIILREDGYHFVMGEDGNDFSGGERQRIEIARALSMDPTIIVMDEATSALDTIVEKKVMENVRAREITTILIAHRLSTIKSCDRIYVFDDGRIIDSGTHDELMKSCDLYRTLVTVE